MRTVLQGGKVVDLDGGPSEVRSIAIEDEKIVIVGDVETRANDLVVDVSGKYLLPGFVNSHAHLGWDGIHDLQDQANEPSAISALKASMNVRKSLSAGVTTIRDLGMNESNQYAKRGIDEGIIPWVRLLINGRAISTTGGHTWWCCREADGVDDCRRAIREQFKLGAEWIKIMASHELSQFTMPELEALVDEAHMNGLKVTAHATFDEAIRRVVDAGVDCVEHGGSMTDKTIAKMVERGTWIVTTFSPLVLQAQRGLEWGMPPHEVERRQNQVNDSARFAGNKAAAEAGIPIAFGTDAGSPVVPHNEIVEELKFMVQVGVCADNHAALRSITIRGAELLGLDNDLGTLERGKTGDVVVLNGDPIADLEAVRDVHQVYVRGMLAHSANGGYAQGIAAGPSRQGRSPEVVMLPEGIYPVAPTPFDSSGAVDLESVGRITTSVIEAGVQGILVLGVMGEADRLLDEERQAVLQRFVQAADGAVAIVAGTSHASAYTTLELTRRAEQVGANAVMVSPPRLAKPNLEAVRAFYETIASGSSIEIVVQDHPGSSGVYMPPNFMAELAADLDNVKAVKLEDPPTPTKMTALRSLAGAGLRIFGGLGGVALVEELDRGAVGTMTGFAFPEVLVQIWQSHRSSDTESARKLFHHHLPLIQFEAQPFISLAIRKRIYQMRGIITSDHLRAPAPQLDAGTIRELETLIREVGLKVGERVAG